ncbi:MAG: lipase family protein, partial [Cyanobacteria bacterium P01_H01_bin.58]
ALLGGVITAAAGIRQYIDQSKRQRRERARSVVQEFSFLESIRNVSDILDYEEYRTFKTTLRDGRTIHFEATDGRLKRALRPHGEMLKTQQGIKMLSQLSAQGKMDENTARVLQKYRDEEFAIELALRSWFDDFLGALEAANNAIEAGIVNGEDIKPFVLYWIRVIGDRRYRRQGGSGFYDQLFHYIVNAGYDGVQQLFERYGYKILPPPYSTNDFNNIAKESSVFESFRSLCMAKAAHLVYEDQEYVEDIVRDWLSDEVVDDVWRKQNPADYVVDVIKFWLREGDRRHVVEIKDHFKYFVDARTDTQAFMFKKGPHIVLVFRGSQQVADWKTNFSFRLRPFAVYDEANADDLPEGKVHRGFQDAWESIERRVVAQLRKWWTKESYFWVTGHSLGGALASLAATSLDYQGFKVNGLYTFGQPRVGEWKFVRQVNARMGKRMTRYVNNNDVVPMVPTQINLLAPTKLYGHMGQFRYFNSRGQLRKQSVLGQRWGDRALGLLISLRQPGLDIIADHMMEFYVRNLQHALDKEKDLQKAQQEEAMNAAELYEIEKAR